MTDLEAQVTTTNAVLEAATVRVPRHELKELVRALVNSAKILQSIVGVDDEATPQEHEMQLTQQSTLLGAISSDCLSLRDDTVDGGSGPQRDPITSKKAVATSEEVALIKDQILKGFDEFCGTGSGSGSPSVDLWKSLVELGWAKFGNRHIHNTSEAGNTYGENEIPPIIQYYATHPDLRLEVQKAMFYGLSRWCWSYSGITGEPDCSNTSRLLDMAPWVALIGMRLPRLPRSEDFNSQGLVGIRVLAVLMVLLQMPQLRSSARQYNKDTEGLFWADSVTVGQVLDECYYQRVLVEPNTTNSMSLKVQVANLMYALELINLWFQFRYVIVPSSIVDYLNVRSLRLSDLLESIKRDEDWYGEVKSVEARDTTFRCREMSLELLRKVGRLNIQWTSFLDEHLVLDTKSSTLKVFWFGFSIMSNPIFHIGCGSRVELCHDFDPDQSGIFHQLSKTYSLLFRSQEDKYKDNLRQYGLLPIPPWVRICYRDSSGILSSRRAKDMSHLIKLKEPWLSDVVYHLAGADSKLPVTARFEDYGMWADRLRVLKAFMDDQKPKGIYSLWTDKRDTLQWYTFWAVVVVGGVGLTLSFLGLIVSIVQTIGTFEGDK